MSNDNSHLPEEKHSSRALLKSTSVISAGTLFSRILGFIRDVLLAKLLGTGVRADAFFVAFRIPNLLRDMVGEGAVNATVVPVISEYRQQKEKEDLWRLISILLVLSLIILSVLTLIGIWGAASVVRLIAPGFVFEAEKFEMTVRLTRLMFPYLVFIGLTAYLAGLLYAFRSFVVPAFSPCLLNVAIIISALWASRSMEEPVFGLAAGVLAGGILQLVAQFFPLWKKGIRFKFPKTLAHPGARRVGRLLIPRLIGSGVYQLNVFVDTFCASLAMIVGQGGISAIYYANRIIQFPMGIFTLALASAALPAMAGFAAVGNVEELKKTLVFSLKNIFFIMVPASVALVVLAEPVIRVLFYRGAFDDYSVQITSWTLLFYALGLFSFGAVKILVTAFHSLQDTSTPVKVASGSVVMNFFLNLILMGPLKVGGIALASSIAATVNFVILFILLKKKIGAIRGDFLPYCMKIIFASALMGSVLSILWLKLPLAHLAWRLFLTGTAGMATFFAMCVLLKVKDFSEIRRWMPGKK